MKSKRVAGWSLPVDHGMSDRLTTVPRYQIGDKSLLLATKSFRVLLRSSLREDVLQQENVTLAHWTDRQFDYQCASFRHHPTPESPVRYPCRLTPSQESPSLHCLPRVYCQGRWWPC